MSTPFFKSHHSGMETPTQDLETLLSPHALNRTIVGWKPERRAKAMAEAFAFKSHHSGMETRFRAVK